MKNEEILLNFNVMYRKIVLKQSCVEVSASFITFSSELFGFNKREVLRLAEVTSIERVGSKIILHPRSSSKRLTFKVASVLVSKDILAKLTPIWKLALWKHYMAILELERSSDTVTCQTALSWLGNEIRSGKGHDVGFSEKNVTRLIYLMRSQVFLLFHSFIHSFMLFLFSFLFSLFFFFFLHHFMRIRVLLSNNTISFFFKFIFILFYRKSHTTQRPQQF